MEADRRRELAQQGIHVINFGALPPLPDGYYVVFDDLVEHYMALGPDWEGDIYCDPYSARRQAIRRAAKMGQAMTDQHSACPEIARTDTSLDMGIVGFYRGYMTIRAYQ